MGARPLAGRLARALEEMGLQAEERRQPDAQERRRQGGLTRRQAEIARLIAAGLTNKEIGQKLFLSTRTVDMHVAKLRKKIEDRPNDPAFIVTVHRLGYKFTG